MKSKRGQWGDETAVSETVGFIIIFGIMLTGIGLVTLYGYPALLDAQANADIRNMERNMISIQSDVKSLAYKSVPFKESTLQISGGSLTIENPDHTAKWFTVYDTTDSSHLLPDPPFPENKLSPGNFKYTSDSNAILISLQNGAVVKRQLDGSVMLSEPRWFVDESSDGLTKTLVVNFIQIDTQPPGQEIAKSGIGVIQMGIEPLLLDDDNILEYTFPQPGHQITIEYHDTNFDYYKAWKNYFINGLSMADTGSGGQISDVDRVILKAWKINVLNI